MNYREPIPEDYVSEDAYEAALDAFEAAEAIREMEATGN